MAVYPGALKTWVDKADLVDFFTAAILNSDIMAEIIAIETELGTDPAGAYATVKAWLDALAAAGGFSPTSIEIKTSDYTITTSDFNKCLRMNSASARTFTLPSVGAGDDGKRVTLMRIGAGNVIITPSDSDAIGDGSIEMKLTEQYSAVTLEYCDSATNWQIVASWPEAASAVIGIKGYFAGGITSSYSTVADKIVFATDTTAAQASANLSLARGYLAGLSERNTKGYFAGGLAGAASAVADKIVFATDTTAAQTSANLSLARYGLAGLSEGNTKGYFAGGFSSSYSAVADKIVFATDTTAAQASANLSLARRGLAGLSDIGL